jgi:hypothetical protein
MIEQTWPVAFEACSHPNAWHDPSDPSVGIFGEVWGCDDCGGGATDWLSDDDESFIAPDWQPGPHAWE